MKTPFTSFLVLIGSIAVIATAGSQPLRNGLHAFVLDKAPSPDTAGQIVADGPTLHYRPHRSHVRQNDEKAEVTIDGASAAVPAFMKSGTTYVAIRQFMQEIHERYGLQFTVSYTATGQVSVDLVKQNQDNGAAFGRGLEELWRGNISKALPLFDKAAQQGGTDSEDARSLANWVREGGDNSSGIIRLSWWSIAPGLDVYIDGSKVIPGTLMIETATGQHSLRIVRQDDGDVLLDQPFGVRREKAFVIQFGGSSIKRPMQQHAANPFSTN